MMTRHYGEKNYEAAVAEMIEVMTVVSKQLFEEILD